MGTKFILGQEDGTAAGGNARGEAAVDLQTSRSSAAAVAIGNFSSLVGGSGNQAFGAYSISGGQLNSAVGSHSVCFGNTNSAGGQSTAVFGQSNSASTNFSTVLGGQSNTASTNTHATVVGGQTNTASGLMSVVIGGQGNTASGERSIAGGYLGISSGLRSIALGDGSNATGTRAIAIGANNTTNSNLATAIGGQFNRAYADFSVVLGGYQSQAYLLNQLVSNSNSGTFDWSDNQLSQLSAYRYPTLTTGGTAILSLDGTGVTNLIIPRNNNRVWKVKVEYVGTITTITGTATGLTVGDSVYGEENFGFKRLAGTSTMGPIMNETQSSDNAIMDTCSLAVTAGASQEMALTFTGPTFAGGGSVTMRVVAKVALVEIAF